MDNCIKSKLLDIIVTILLSTPLIRLTTPIVVTEIKGDYHIVNGYLHTHIV